VPQQAILPPRQEFDEGIVLAARQPSRASTCCSRSDRQRGDARTV